MTTKKAWEKIGTVRKGKNGNFYVKLSTDVELPEGRVIQLQDPHKKLDDSVAKGWLTEEKAEEIRAKIPDYIKYELVLPPEN